jgi:hypothetical protein
VGKLAITRISFVVLVIVVIVAEHFVVIVVIHYISVAHPCRHHLPVLVSSCTVPADKKRGLRLFAVEC